MNGLRLAQITTGLAFDTGGIVVTEAHIVAFAGVSGDFFDVHMDDLFAQAQGFKGRVAHGLLGLALVDGLKNRAEVRFDAVASLEWTYTFLAPVVAGDRIHAHIQVESVRPTRDGRHGVVKLAIDVLNGQGACVQRGVNTLLVNA